MLPYKVETVDVQEQSDDDWSGQIDVIKKFVNDKFKPLNSNIDRLKKNSMKIESRLDDIVDEFKNTNKALLEEIRMLKNDK